MGDTVHVLRAFERQRDRRERSDRDVHFRSVAGGEHVRQSPQRIDQIAGGELDRGCPARELATDRRRGRGILLERRQAPEFDSDVAAVSLRQFIDAGLKSRQHRHEPLAHLLPQPFPLGVRGVQYRKTKIITFIDDVDRACLHRCAVQLEPDRAYLDPELPAIGCPVRGAKGARGRATAAGCVIDERTRADRNVAPRKPQELFRRVSVRRHGRVVDD